jgi:divalent metal cation (Fe/Co/Zn/Cd) transporter
MHTAQEISLYRAAMAWAVFGIVYNLIEGAVSTWFGAADETLALFGFGIDSFIEAISALGIAHMVWRIRTQQHVERDRFERGALRITGVCFYLLAASLVIGAAINLWQGNAPESTLAGVVISTISILVMWLMLWSKLKIGRALHSDAMVADAKCTQVCIYMSLVLLAASGLYALTQIGWLDAVGALLLAWFSVQEGREALEKAAGKHHCDHC